MIEALERLRAATPSHQIQRRKGPGGKMLDYVTARFVMDRLDEAVGPENWQTKFHEVAGKVSCSIGVKVGDDWVWKSDGAGETAIEGEKGSFSDALKRAGVHWGIARDLYPDAAQDPIALFKALSEEKQAAFLAKTGGKTIEQLDDETRRRAIAWMRG